MNYLPVLNAVVGDHHAKEVFSSYSFGVNGLPVYSLQLDDVVKQLVTEDKYNRIYISPAYPLAGIKKIEEIKQKYDNPEDCISFEEKECGFFNDTNWREFIEDRKEVELLWNYWQSKVKYLYELSPNIWILPISLYWYEMKIVEEVPKIYSDVVRDFSQCVDVASILKGNRFYHINKFGLLSDQAIALISKALIPSEIIS